MVAQVRLRRGPTAQNQAYTGNEGEVTYDKERKTAVVHDGATVGGIPLLRADEPRGFSKLEVFTSSGTWTKANKPDLRRIIVYVHAGGGGGANASGGRGGSQGGNGYVELDVANLTTNVSVTVGAGGATTVDGGNTFFGSYILANGGNGPSNGNYGGGPVGGNVVGTGTIDLGSHPGKGGGYSASANANYGWSWGPGGGSGGGADGGLNANGVVGAGGSGGGNGAQGSVMVYEIYGEY